MDNEAAAESLVGVPLEALFQAAVDHTEVERAVRHHPDIPDDFKRRVKRTILTEEMFRVRRVIRILRKLQPRLDGSFNKARDDYLSRNSDEIRDLYDHLGTVAMDAMDMDAGVDWPPRYPTAPAPAP